MSKRLNMSKTILFIMLLIGIITSFPLVSVFAESSDIDTSETNVVNTRNKISTQNDFISVFSFTPTTETECSVRLADKTVTRAIVPEKVEINGKEYVVTAIAANGFTSATKLEMVRLPKSVKTIGANAFANCKALTTITLPAVETIGANAFAMTAMDYLIIPTTVTSVASTILRGTDTQVYVRSALEEGATTPEGWASNWNGSNKNQAVEFNSSFVPEVKYELVSSEIATFALGDDEDDEEVEGYYVTAFQEFCTIDTDDYKEVYIPATHIGEDGKERKIIGIDSGAFYYNDIEKVTIGYSKLPITIATESFYGLNGSLITINREVELLSDDFYGGKAISESVFAGSTVSTIILPNSLQAIGNNMFDGCENLRDVHFIEPYKTLSPNAEANINLKLSSTQKIELPNTVTFIGDYAFAQTENILELHIPNSVEIVGTDIILEWTSNQTVYVDFVADDPILDNWNENWSISSENKHFTNIVFKFSDNAYQITYNIDNEYHNNPNTYISSEGLTLLPVEMTGYTFVGWFLDENFTKPIESISIGTAGDLALYARLVGNEYTIKYEKNCPAIASNLVLGDMNESVHVYNKGSSLSVNKYTLKGWVFIGWNSQADGSGESYSDEATVSTFAESGTKKLYAQWEQKTYKLNFYGNRPNDATSKLEGNMLAEMHSYEDEFNLKKSAYILKGWKFKGWNTEIDGTGATYKDEQTVKNLTETEINLYAQWEVSTYTVEYDKNKPSNTDFKVEGVMDSSTHIYDVSSFLRINAYVLEGYTFDGWNTEADGSGKSYINGAEIQTLTSDDSIQLYAQWKARTYIIEYKENRPSTASNSVTGETSVSNHTVDSYGILSPNAFSLKGWTFVEWNTKADGSGITYKNKDNVKNVTTSSSTIELYAQWKAKEFSIQYETNEPRLASNETKGSTINSSHIVDAEKTLTANCYTLIGWTFTGWNTEADGSGTYYPNSCNVKIATDESLVKFYAQWEAKSFSIQYEPNRPTNASNEVAGITRNSTHSDKEYKILTPNEYTLIGWMFTGWNTEADGSGIPYADKSNIKIATDESLVKLYAQWEAKSFTIQYNQNKPTDASNEVGGTTNNSTHSDKEYKVLTTNGYTLKGWTFTGWNTEADGSGIPYADKNNIKIATDESIFELYAQWVVNKYTVIYDNNGGSGTMNPSTLTYETSSRLSKNIFTSSGKHFFKWTTNPNGTGTSYNDEADVSKMTDNNGVTITLYAQWQNNEYKVQYKPNKPSNATNAVERKTKESEHVANNSQPLNPNEFTLKGWTFTGWNTKADGSGTFYHNQQEVNMTCDDGEVVELYAQWRPNTYTIHYNANLPEVHSELQNTLPETTHHAYDTASPINAFYILVSWRMTGWKYNGKTYEANKAVTDLTEIDGDEITLEAEWELKSIFECKNAQGVYEIVDPLQLKDISTIYGYKYILLCDATFDESWIAIPEFRGELDLNQHTITYCQNNLSSNVSYGFIIKNYGTIKNGSFKPNIKQSFINSSQTEKVYIGGVVAENRGTIFGVQVLSHYEDNNYMNAEETVTDINACSNMCFIGGIVGINYSKIERCTNQASLGGAYFIGGIAGENQERATIDNCKNEGKILYCSISGNNKCVGGIAGSNYAQAVIRNCENSGEIVFAYRIDNSSKDVVYMARIVGWSHSSETISNCDGSLDKPITIQAKKLNLYQAEFIKINGDNISKVSENIGDAHDHTFLYISNGSNGHKKVCLCGEELTQAHMVKYADRNNDYAVCMLCEYRLNLKTDRYIVEFGPEIPILNIPSNEMLNIGSNYCLLTENNILLDKKDLETYFQENYY